jgi:hypothetical protein
MHTDNITDFLDTPKHDHARSSNTTTIGDGGVNLPSPQSNTVADALLSEQLLGIDHETSSCDGVSADPTGVSSRDHAAVGDRTESIGYSDSGVDIGDQNRPYIEHNDVDQVEEGHANKDEAETAIIDIDPFALDESYHFDRRTAYRRQSSGNTTNRDGYLTTPINAESRLRSRSSLDTDRRAVMALDVSFDSSRSSTNSKGEGDAIYGGHHMPYPTNEDKNLDMRTISDGLNDLDLGDYNYAFDDLNDTRVVIGLNTPGEVSCSPRSGSPSSSSPLEIPDVHHPNVAMDLDAVEVIDIANASAHPSSYHIQSPVQSDSALFAEDLEPRLSPNIEVDGGFDVSQWVSERTGGGVIATHDAPLTTNASAHTSTTLSASTVDIPRTNTEITTVAASNATWVAPLRPPMGASEEALHSDPDASNTTSSAIDIGPSDSAVTSSDVFPMDEVDVGNKHIDGRKTTAPTVELPFHKHSASDLSGRISETIMDDAKPRHGSSAVAGPSRIASVHALKDDGLPAIHSLEALHEVLAVLRADMERSAKRDAVSDHFIHLCTYTYICIYI